jgi:cell division protein ZapE
MPAPLTQIYDDRVAQGLIRPDAAQRALLPLFEPARAWALAPAPTGLIARLRKPAPPPRGVYLWGGVGRGKSMLMDLMVAATDTPAIRRVHFHAFMQEVHAGMHAARQTGVTDTLVPVGARLAQGLRLLALDEMQITDITDAMVVGRLFQMLTGAGVAIVTTSNRPPQDLYKDGLNRALFLPFIAWIEGHLQVAEIASETDYRQHRLAGARVWFQPSDAAARAAMAALWADLTGGDPGAPLVLTVKGRAVRLPAHHNGVARASFWDLCGQPLGPADYLAIAEAVRVLMVEDIPRLSASNYNEARRFVTLIDTLYEARVRLIASAADRPDRLYLEGAGAFEFERTASRLAEMQAADWGS